MRVVLTAGGSGGHITPLLAVATELKKLRPDIQTIYIGQKGDRLGDVPAAHCAIDETYTVRAGKFRRYHGEGWRQLLDLGTQAKNIRDAVWVLVGTWQSYWLMRRLQPDVIFTRGGFVSVPVALAGKLNGVPYITHDSDSTPSLANRIIARWATLHAVSLPVDLYPYPRGKTVMVGVPVSDAFVPVTQKIQQSYRKELGLDAYEQIVLVTGGGNGAAQLNRAIVHNAAALVVRYPKLAIVHIAGRALEEHVSKAYDDLHLGEARKRVMIKGFVTDLYRYSGAADIVVARGGATGIVEFAQQHKACIIIPAKQLIWQEHHAKVMEGLDAIIYLAEDESNRKGRLGLAIQELLDHPDVRQHLGEKLATFARPDAAKHLAMVLLAQAHAK
ncbi:MAG: UDP-N-acetylglucosamine--N-acetylmuramyl-(pentapeptide) pyrophosphoryl-undecaprenol N-acetylglucosamine transferase [Candidatus Micrarchaeaceae archaeon]